ncbi:MAG: TrmH family RNA methyltransferase [Candidatus Wolfebacteria bacterium]|nr:TrmH family RNA methyltransferase [Candidatus Wolfebacteria bacterium]
MIVILYNIRSLYNVGSIFRTADGAGTERIYLCGITPAPIDAFGKPRKQFTKVSLGAEKYLEWDASARSPRAIAELLKELKKDGYKIFAIEQSKKSIPYFKAKTSAKGGSASGGKNSKLVLIMGNEVRGLPEAILKKADKILEIPMRGKKESLNVSVAFGIAAYALTNSGK